MSLLTIQEVNQGIKQLPALSTVVMDILNIIDREDIEIAVLDKLISNDQGLVTRVLRVANSAFYGMSGQINSVKDACILLGIHTLRHLVLAASVIDQFPPNGGGNFDRMQLWRHAVGVGVSARVLARQCRQDPEQAFTAGLLHDIGKLALDVCFPEHFAVVLRHRDSAGSTLLAAEAAVLGIDHTHVGARLAELWRLPAPICAAIARHHSPDSTLNAPLVDLVHVADLVCRALEIGSGGDSLMPPLSAGAMARLGLSWERIGNVLPEIDALNRVTNILD